MPQKVEILQTYFEEVWANANLDAIDDLLSPNARTLGVMGDVPFDKNELRELVSMLRPMLGAMTIHIARAVEQDDWLSALVEINSTSKQDGTPVRVFNHVFARFDQHHMTDIYSGVDGLNLFEQLGLLPESAMAVMLGGTRLG